MTNSFDEWMSKNNHTLEGKTFLQYAHYIEGWQKTFPWYYRGMSLAYNAWAEKRWEEIQDKDRLIKAWKDGLAIKLRSFMINKKEKPGDEDKWERSIDRGWLGKTAEEAADFMLTFEETLESLICLAIGLH